MEIKSLESAEKLPGGSPGRKMVVEIQMAVEVQKLKAQTQFRSVEHKDKLKRTERAEQDSGT